MINWLLVLSLAIIMMITFYSNQKCFLSPPFIVSSVMFITALLLAFNTDYWGYVISIDTYYIIVLAVLFFSFGHLLTYKSSATLFSNHSVSIVNYELKQLKKKHYYLLMIVSVVLFLAFAYHQYSNASSIGMSGSLSQIVIANRWYVENKSGNEFFKLIFVIHRVIAYFSVFVFFYNLIIRKRKEHLLLTIIIVIPYFFCCALSSNRSDVIAAIGFFLFIIMFLVYYKSNWLTRKENKRLIFFVIILMVFGVFLFRLLGYLTGKSTLSNAYDNVSLYAGSSFISFDIYLQNKGTSFPLGDKPLLFRGIYSIFNMIGFNIDAHAFYKPHQYWGRWGANVYSSLLEYHMKFGFIGLLVMELLIGSFYGIFWKKMRNNHITWPSIIILGELFFYYLCMYSIDERLFSQFFTLTSFVEVFFILFLYKRVFTIKK